MSTKRLCRLTWNDNRWESPSGHKWHSRNVKDPYKPFEQKFGFGHEEWLLSPAFRLDDYQYGFVQGVSNLSGVSNLDELHLFTIQDETLDRYYLGHILNVEVISYEKATRLKLPNMVNRYFDQMVSELRAVGANHAHFQEYGYLPNVRFKSENQSLLHTPQLITSKAFSNRFFRFIPFHFTEKVKQLLGPEYTNPSTSFTAGTPGDKLATYHSSRTAKSFVVNKLHNLIEADLYKYLIEVKRFSKACVGCGRLNVDGNIADIAYKNGTAYEIFEIKTTGSTRLNIRTALGQLLDYALWTDEPINKLIIVAPTNLDKASSAYFKRLKQKIRISLEYWQYKADGLTLAEKFIVI